MKRGGVSPLGPIFILAGIWGVISGIWLVGGLFIVFGALGLVAALRE